MGKQRAVYLQMAICGLACNIDTQNPENWNPIAYPFTKRKIIEGAELGDNEAKCDFPTTATVEFQRMWLDGNMRKGLGFCTVVQMTDALLLPGMMQKLYANKVHDLHAALLRRKVRY